MRLFRCNRIFLHTEVSICLRRDSNKLPYGISPTGIPPVSAYLLLGASETFALRPGATCFPALFPSRATEAFFLQVKYISTKLVNHLYFTKHILFLSSIPQSPYSPHYQPSQASPQLIFFFPQNDFDLTSLFLLFYLSLF